MERAWSKKEKARHEKRLLSLCKSGTVDEIKAYLCTFTDEQQALLLQAKAAGNEQLSCLHIAAANDQSAVVHWLLLEHAYLFPDSRKLYARTPLHEAALYGHDDVVRVLLCRGALVSPHTTRGRTPLMYAARGGHIAVMARLLDAGADIDEQSETGLTALYEAAKHGRQDAVALLLARGADMHRSSHTRHSPLHVAIGEGYVEVADQLILAGADPAATDAMGVTVWHEAAGTGPTVAGAMVNLLRKHDVHLSHDLVDVVMARHPFHYAAVEGHDSFVAALLEARLVEDVNMQDADGCSAVYYASANGHVAVLRRLLAAGADLNVVSIRRSPLHCAVAWQRLHCVNLLLAHGAHRDALDLEGLTPLDIALKCQFTAIVEVLATPP
ncbi:ankyrin-like protein [Achlya hypogyna]|uniref:Ankyrin-like protein n=1 Tax=Achlya hypogyna TaxID=1202772 RepID=A0A1V9YJY0_ACHHY|nr:ankyrin-like protein [Achlya hypogyna]